ncbi:hypothetical protein [Mycoplasma sp. 'Moose RK']|uniref:hypothetical protein n=1 Tax=Mycoplasma sp. 'Moose RK' TaxID=2780095 RepID=UPI0018C21E48|nr:hypothetical protein [Mycoplasma sp. 'Moose RK']MBG0730923.1 hypothetical protein [Mycoplasma sp. 'Moose RK']
MEKNSKWVSQIKFNLQRYQKIVEKLKTVAISLSQNERTTQILLNVLDFPHGIGLRKLPFLKGWPAKKINVFIISGKFREKFTNFSKWDNSDNRALLNQIKAKLVVWEYYLAFLEGDYQKTKVAKEVFYAKKLYFFRGLIWKSEKYTMVVGLNKFRGSGEYKSDYCSFYTALLTHKDITNKVQLVENIWQIKRIWYNQR